jgi:cellulose synthase (UDP-forming)
MAKNKSYAVLTTSTRRTYYLLVVVWVLVNTLFWLWWLQARHVGSGVLFSLTSLALFYETTVLPSFYLFFIGKMRRPEPVKPPHGLRVAMVTLCVPKNESIEVIERQLQAMIAVKYPHDSWILDEGNDPQVKALAESYGVKHFSRKGVEKYNQPLPPFKAKTKAGNVNAWIDSHGNDYEIFVQLDIDHRPKPSYLHSTLGYFRDSKVAWVQAPSVYDNFQHWTARGSAEQELVLQGPLQMGFYGFTQTPYIIGSHCTYRMSAIKEIDGFQPTRAEDHLDTVVLAGRGYTGVFVPEPIAIGDGPENFDTYLSQQFAWAYSMIQVLFEYTPKYFRYYGFKQSIQFLFSQTWYTLWGTSMLLLFLMPLLALMFNTPITINTPFFTFLIVFTPVMATSCLAWLWSRRWFQPQGIGLTWRGVVLHIARWPIVVWALINVIFRVQKPYMITSKGVNVGLARPFNLQSQMPYFGLIGLSLFSVWWFMWQHGQTAVQGYLIYAIQGALIMCVVYAISLMMDLYSLLKEGVHVFRVVMLRLQALVILGLLLLMLYVSGNTSAPLVAQAVMWNDPNSSLAIDQSPPGLMLSQIVGAFYGNSEIRAFPVEIESFDIPSD